MPSLQSKVINVLLRLLRTKQTVNRMRQHVESGDRTYTEPSRKLHRKHRIMYAGAAYARGVAPKGYLVSPVYGSLNDLAPVTLFIGTRDIFLPDCRKLRDKAIAENAQLNYREYDGMVHDWMLGPIPEAKQVLREIVNQLKEEQR